MKYKSKLPKQSTYTSPIGKIKKNRSLGKGPVAGKNSKSWIKSISVKKDA